MTISASVLSELVQNQNFLKTYVNSESSFQSNDNSFIGTVLEDYALKYLGKKKNTTKFIAHGISGVPDIFEVDEEKKTILIGEIKCPSFKKDLKLLQKNTYTQMNIYAMLVREAYPDYKIVL